MSTLNYLAYGSNLWPARLRERIGPLAVRGAIRVPDRTLAFSKRGADGSGKCTLASAPGATAWGVVYTVPAAARAVLDRIEGVGHGYTIEWLALRGHGRCFVYLAEPDACDPALRPFDWYRALVLAGAQAHGLPPAYVSRIRTTITLRDAERERAARHFALLGRPA
jgi:gamma-glutamylcyclotransferase